MEEGGAGTKHKLPNGTAKPKASKTADKEASAGYGCTPLMYACQQGDYNKVVEVLKSDENSVWAVDRCGRGALHYCCSGAASGASARAACADRLLMSAPRLAAIADSDGLTPLHLAVVDGDVPLVNVLIANGAHLHALDNEKHSVVHWATVCGEIGALRAVLAAGADPETPDQHGGYPLHYAAQMCGAPASPDHQGERVALDVLRTLLRDARARVDVRDADGRAPLLWAASAGSVQAVLALHRAGASIDDSDRDGLTALHCAASRGHTACVEALLTLCGAAADARDAGGCAPLHYAAALGRADAAALLLRHGAGADARDAKGRTPAHCAAARGQQQVVAMLGSHKANLWLRNLKGDLPLHEAVSSGRRDLVKWFLDIRPSQANATNNDGRTSLHIAANTDNTDLCRVLLDKGAQINPVMKTSKNVLMTPLDCAIHKGFRSTAKYLQMHGGLPVSRLDNKDILIDQVPIMLPQRHIKSTKINVKDQIEIERKEIFETSPHYSSPKKRRHIRQYQSDSSEYVSDHKSEHSKGSYGRKRERFRDKQKSFSDGYDSDKKTKRSREKVSSSSESRKARKKGRSRSEPGSKRKDHSRHRKHRHTSSSSESSESEETKKYKRHKKRKKNRSKRMSRSSSTSSETASTSERHAHKTKHKQKSSREEKKREEVSKSRKSLRKEATIKEDEDFSVVNKEKEEVAVKSKNKFSGSETDTNSLKDNTLITEAQVHASLILPTEADAEKIQEKEKEEVPESKAIAAEGAITPDTQIVSSKKADIQVVEGNIETKDETPEVEEAATQEKPAQESETTTTEISQAEIVTEDTTKNDEALNTVLGEIIDHAKEAVIEGDKAEVAVPDDIETAVEPEILSSTSDPLKKEITFQDPSSDSIVQPDRGLQKILGESEEEAAVIEDLETKSRKSSHDSSSRRKSSIYETESYKVLSDIVSGSEIIMDQTEVEASDGQKPRRFVKEVGMRVPSLSDNEMYGNAESLSGRRKRLRKKNRTKSRSSTIRSKSENSEQGYESSGLMDSGFEPSPRIVHKTRIMSPRLAAYYEKRNASCKYNEADIDSRIPVRKPGDKNAVDMTSVTQRIQTNMRRYYCERKIFQQLLELKRLQIRTSKANEAVLVKRAIDAYNKSSMSLVGAGQYSSKDYTFKTFEKFLYDSLRKLQRSGAKHLSNLPDHSFDFDYGKSTFAADSVPDNPIFCTNKTHRCFHAVHAYTGIPCAAYIPLNLNHHTMPKPGTDKGKTSNSFLPDINKKRGSSNPQVTLELCHGTEKQLIALPSEKLDKNKRYYVTFTVKGSNLNSDDNGKSDEGRNINSV